MPARIYTIIGVPKKETFTFKNGSEGPWKADFPEKPNGYF